MKEELLHYLWQHKLFFTTELKTSMDEFIEVISIGVQNENSGPDFFNAKIRIGEQLWAGNVEIHLKSSDWYVHHHEVDPNYDTVILHVVWQHDVEVYNCENNEIPTLELQSFVSKEVLKSYQNLFSKQRRWVNCENDIQSVNAFVLSNWKERLYFERLEEKSILIVSLLQKTKHNWEAVLFVLLAKNFGLKVNADAFMQMATSIDFAIVRKERGNQMKLESLFFGQLEMLNGESESSYFNLLKKEYNYQQKKYKLQDVNRSSVEYFRLRPPNFPTIRISQFATLFNTQQNLFSALMQLKRVDEFYRLLAAKTSSYWEIHYTFEKESAKRTKKLSKSFIDLLLINTVIPLQFVYLKEKGKPNMNRILELIKQLKPEKNSIVSKFNELNISSKNAFESQAFIHLKKRYCTPQKCLQCAVGNYLLKH